MKRGVLGAVILLGAILIFPPPAFAEEPVPSVTWPQVTRFNPDLTPYTFTVEDSGTSPLYARWHNPFSAPGPLEPVGHTGDHTMGSFGYEGTGVIELLRCPTETTCTVVATSPQLTVFTRLYAFMEPYGPFTTNGTPVLAMTTEPAVAGEHVTVDWTLRSRLTGHTVAEGSAQLIAEDNQGLVHFPLNGTEELPDGPYVGNLTVSAETADFGTLTDAMPFGITPDHEPFSGSVALNRTWIAPKPDGFRDCVSIVLTASEMVLNVQVIVLDETGHAVALPYDDPMKLRHRTRWCGRDFHGHRVAPGHYKIHVFFVDYGRWGGVDESSVDVRRG